MRAQALLLASTASTLIPGAGHHPIPGCKRTFTASMFERAAKAVYRGTRTPPERAYGHLSHYAKCQRPPSSEHRARVIWGRYRTAWVARRREATQMSTATASWYEDQGATASGFHAYYGVANLSLSFGTRVRFCYPAHSARCLTATVDDRGPYISGRTWDLNQNTAGALGFSGVDTVSYRVGG